MTVACTRNQLLWLDWDTRSERLQSGFCLGDPRFVRAYKNNRRLAPHLPLPARTQLDEQRTKVERGKLSNKYLVSAAEPERTPYNAATQAAAIKPCPTLKGYATSLLPGYVRLTHNRKTITEHQQYARFRSILRAERATGFERSESSDP
jgi:hypothetical protein